jgi:hypothetical protein
MYPGKAYQSIVNKLLNLLGSTLVAGDLIQATAANTLARLAIGANNRLLGVDGSGVLGYRQLGLNDIPANLIHEIDQTGVGSAFSSTSTTPTPVTSSTKTINPAGVSTYYLLYLCIGTLTNNTLNAVTVIQPMVDGASAGGFSSQQVTVANAGYTFCLASMLGPYSGSHTFGLGTSVSAGTTGSVNAFYQSLIVVKK